MLRETGGPMDDGEERELAKVKRDEKKTTKTVTDETNSPNPPSYRGSKQTEGKRAIEEIYS